MKRSVGPEDERVRGTPMPESSPWAEPGASAYPPAVPGRFWKGVVIGLCLTAAIGYGLYALWS